MVDLSDALHRRSCFALSAVHLPSQSLHLVLHPVCWEPLSAVHLVLRPVCWFPPVQERLVLVLSAAAVSLHPQHSVHPLHL